MPTTSSACSNRTAPARQDDRNRARRTRLLSHAQPAVDLRAQANKYANFSVKYRQFVVPLIGPVKLRRRGSEFEAAAKHLESASTHWMRHTAGSHLSENADIKVGRDNLGHASISTTSVYLHSEDDSRHDATAAAHRVGWATT